MKYEILAIHWAFRSSRNNCESLQFTVTESVVISIRNYKDLMQYLISFYYENTFCSKIPQEF